MARVLPEGVYERVVTHGLDRSLQRTRAAGLRTLEDGLDRTEGDSSPAPTPSRASATSSSARSPAPTASTRG